MRIPRSLLPPLVEILASVVFTPATVAAKESAPVITVSMVIPFAENSDVIATVKWKGQYHDGRDRPEAIFSLGERYRLNAAHDLLAEILPPDKVIRRDSRHAWGV